MAVCGFGVLTQQPIDNDAIMEALAMASPKWVVEQFPQRRRWWQIEPPAPLYSLVNNMPEYGQHQIINFYTGQGNGSINLLVPADLIVAYLMGAANASPD